MIVGRLDSKSDRAKALFPRSKKADDAITLFIERGLVLRDGLHFDDALSDRLALRLQSGRWLPEHDPFAGAIIRLEASG